jgi:two-component system, response regulator
MRPILLVEDNVDDVDLTLMALEQEHIANPMEVARDGVEALARLEDTSKPVPMLVLLDLKLPRISGLEVLKRIRANERTHNVPVVVLTSSREESDLGSTYDSGANAYVRKPVDFDRFTEIVRQLGLFWLVTNEPPPEARGEIEDA